MVEEIQEEIIDRAVHSGGKKPDCYLKIEWNRSTMNCFQGKRKPRQGRKYCAVIM